MKQEVEIAILQKENSDLKDNVDNLKSQLSELKRLVFGSKSERFITDQKDGQIDLFTGTSPDQQEPIKQQEITYTRKQKTSNKKKPVRTELPSYLPRVEEIIEPSNVAPGSKKIGEEVTEVLEYNPANVFVRRIVRPKYAKPNNEGVVIAELPSLPLPRSNAGASILAYILVSKFIDHLPFYRQIQMFKRQELFISQSTMNDWFNATCKLLVPLYDVLKEQIINDSDYLQADESPIKVQDSHKKGALHQGYMWLFRNPESKLVLFEYNKGRSREAPEEVLRNFSGVLQTDGYRVYPALRTNGEIKLMGCMAHARRYFEKALSNDVTRSEYVLLQIQKLYDMERKARERGSSNVVIKRYRKRCAKPILDDLEKWLNKSSFDVLPKSDIGKAIAYTQKIFPALVRYLDDGKYEIDNNNIENAVRPLAVGRKNYLFAGSHNSAQNIAMMYSFFASCKANKVNPFSWLKDVLTVLPEHKANKLEELLPNNWGKTAQTE